jgi:hypothetical protein
MDLPLRSGPHDRGGLTVDRPLNLSDYHHEDWELIIESISAFLGDSGIRTVHEARRAQESIPASDYEALSYYERWAVANEKLLIDCGLLSVEEIDERAALIRANWTSE